MWSKNKPRQSASEAEHAARIAELPCSVCDAPPPSEVHEAKQGQWFTSMALCGACHRDGFSGWHGQRRAWAVRKMDELDALAVTIERLVTA